MAEELPDLTDSERLALKAVKRFEDLVNEFSDVEDKLREDLARLHALRKDMGMTMKEAHDAIKVLSRQELRKYLAKEAETMAQRVREDIKRDKALGKD